MKKNEELKNARHPMEIPLTIVSIILTIATCTIVSILCVKAATNEEALKSLMVILETDNQTVEWLVKFGSWAIIVILVYFIIGVIYVNKVYIGKSSIKATRLKDTKYKEVNNTLIEYCKKLGIKKTPLAYIENQSVDSSFLGVKIRSDNALSIDSKVLKNCENSNDYSRVNYLLARRLSHIYLGHNNVWLVVFTFVGKLIPIYNNLYERVLCYSADKVVEYLIGEENTMKGIFSTFYDDSFYEPGTDFIKIVQDRVKTENQSEGFGRFLENLLSDDPLPNYRLEAIMTGRNGRLF